MVLAECAVRLVGGGDYLIQKIAVIGRLEMRERELLENVGEKVTIERRTFVRRVGAGQGGGYGTWSCEMQERCCQEKII
jgi:hypothetical protein